MRGTSTAAPSPTGTLTRNTQGQLSALVSAPPSRTPTPPPPLAIPPHKLNAVPRGAPGWVEVAIESADGVSSAAPQPWTARAATRKPGEGASPHASDAPVNTNRPARNVRRRPTMSAARPPTSSRPPLQSTYAVTTHWRSAGAKPSPAPIEGSATFTNVMSSTTINGATASRASSGHEVRSSVDMDVNLAMVYNSVNPVRASM